jgi:hypothetical protein
MDTENYRSLAHLLLQAQFNLKETIKMATEKIDPRAELAKMEAEEAAANEAAAKLTEKNAAKRKELKDSMRDADLADVREKCKLHGFTASDLRTFLKVKGAAKKATPRKSTTRKPAAKKRTAKA